MSKDDDLNASLQTPADAPPPQRGFFRSLADLSFDHFISSRLVKALYVLLIVWSALTGVTAFTVGSGLCGAGVWAALKLEGTAMTAGLVTAGVTWVVVVLASIVGTLGLIIVSRVVSESAIIMFRIADHLQTMARLMKEGARP